jgi:hypothetical protein
MCVVIHARLERRNAPYMTVSVCIYVYVVCMCVVIYVRLERRNVPYMPFMADVCRCIYVYVCVLVYLVRTHGKNAGNATLFMPVMVEMCNVCNCHIRGICIHKCGF